MKIILQKNNKLQQNKYYWVKINDIIVELTNLIILMFFDNINIEVSQFFLYVIFKLIKVSCFF